MASRKPTSLEVAMLVAEQYPGTAFVFDPAYEPGKSSASAMCTYVRKGNATAQKKGWVPKTGWEDTRVVKAGDMHPMVLLVFTKNGRK